MARRLFLISLMMLKPRQLECLTWVMAGKSSREIGLILGMSRKTVDEHIGNACEILGVRTRTQAVALAIAEGLLSPSTRNVPGMPREQ